jgi:hypothetical protein
MLLAVSGIVHATPSFATLEAAIGVPRATRWLCRSPFASGHGGAATVPDVVIARATVTPTSTNVAVTYARRPRAPPGKLGRRMPTVALMTAQAASVPPAR